MAVKVNGVVVADLGSGGALDIVKTTHSIGGGDTVLTAPTGKTFVATQGNSGPTVVMLVEVNATGTSITLDSAGSATDYNVFWKNI